MNPYLRNLLILTLIGTVNFLVFVFMSGRSSLLLGRNTSPVGPSVNTAPDIHVHVSKKKDSVLEGLSMHGVVQSYQPPTAKEHATNRSAADSGTVSIFHTPTNSSRERPRKQLENDKPSSVAVGATNMTKAAKQGITQIHVHTVHHSANGVLALYHRDDSARRNPHNYRLVLDEPQACLDVAGAPKDVFLLVLICTIHKNFEQRAAIRETWGSPKEIDGKKIVTLFLLAHNEDAHLQRQVEEECSEHHDLLQEDFMDTYKNLTLKTIMGMKWAYTHCSHASYVMKTDDDMYVNYANLVKHLSNTKTLSSNYAAGFLINGGPIRDRKNKWYMPKELYPQTKYPPFLSGTGYVMSGDVTGKIYEKSLDTGYLHLEDVFVAVCLSSLGIKPVKIKDFNNWRTVYSYCRFRRLITTHMVQPSEMHRIWKDQHRHHTVAC